MYVLTQHTEGCDIVNGVNGLLKSVNLVRKRGFGWVLMILQKQLPGHMSQKSWSLMYWLHLLSLRRVLEIFGLDNCGLPDWDFTSARSCLPEGQKYGFLIWLRFSYCGLICIACMSIGKWITRRQAHLPRAQQGIPISQFGPRYCCTPPRTRNIFLNIL
ncbi:uncharacterized protein LOC141682864 [Apium graveolens]|uniref:uncharacterized protein LOC141682864 n=1 Tax=Apium graveolens TaxID=4045 RepID=UPI003D7AB8FA